ncbi:MAG: DNA/RNA nuclease SfsA [Gammaproteobacteria bacterium]|nr:DNA/RNA nuclease SfsA [Gammaproteobacteria bacterium]
MQYTPLCNGKLLRRYKRFLADVELPNGSIVVAHCPNTGSMATCWGPGVPVQLSHSDNPKRKLPWTLERVDMGAGWVGVNTGRVNTVIAEGVASGAISHLTGYDQIVREPPYSAHGFPPSRFDLLLSSLDLPDAYVEIKNTTLLEGDCIKFPDAVTKRGRKHLALLAVAVQQGYRGVIVFAINRPEGSYFAPAEDIDPAYADTLESVWRKGVEIIVVRLRHTREGIEVAGSVQY